MKTSFIAFMAKWLGITALTVSVAAIVMSIIVSGIFWPPTANPGEPDPISVDPQTLPFAPTTPRPPDALDVVVKDSVVTRLEIPAIGFDSETAGQKFNPKAKRVPDDSLKHPITQWTQAMNVANGYVLSPPVPWNSTVVWDSTIAGGGLFGTNTKCPGLIAAHTTPYWKDVPVEELGAFQFLWQLKPGDEVAITTTKGRIFYKVSVKPTPIPKGEAGARLRSSDPATCDGPRGRVNLVTCSRGKPNPGTAATTENLVVVIEVDQELTNRGSFTPVKIRDKGKW